MSYPEDFNKFAKAEGLTDKVIECLKFAVKSTKDLGGIKEMGIKGYNFSAAGHTVGDIEVLIDKGYLSRQMIVEPEKDLISGMYIALTGQGLRLYNNLPKEVQENKP